MPKQKPEPPEDLLDKIEEIGSIKRELPLQYRSLSSITNLYVQSGHVFGGGVQYMAGGGKILTNLVFERRGDGTRDVRKYKPGDWELKVDDTLVLCRLLQRASRVPDGWLADKIAAYELEHPVDLDLFNSARQAYLQHREELLVIWEGGSPVERLELLLQVFWHELEEEWPVEYLEASLQKQGQVDPVTGTVVNIIKLAWGLGYMLGKRWIRDQELAEAHLQLGRDLADIVRSRLKKGESRATGFAGALSAVVAKGTAEALSVAQG